MSETANTLINSAMRVIGVLSVGETPTADESNDGLLALQMMLRHWSAKNIRLYYTKNESLTLTAATSYTIGTLGDLNTVRPVSIRGAWVRDSNGVDHIIDIIDEKKYRELSLKSFAGVVDYLWYSPEYPLGKIYIYPAGTGTLYIDSLKPLTDPSLITSSVAFPPEYDEAIKYGLAVRLAGEYGRPLSPEIPILAATALADIETRNFASQIVAARPEIIKIAQRYNINEG